VEAAYYDDLIRGVVSGRRFIVCADVLVAAHAQAKGLRELGASKPFLIAGSLGTGELPTESDADWMIIGSGGGSVMQSIRSFEVALLSPTAELLAALDRFDPGREAIVLGTIFMRDGEHFGRRAYGTRPRSWEALEDKVVIDEVFDAALVRRGVSEVVAADAGALEKAHAKLDRGLGTAIAGDAREGWWGGAEYLRWVRSDDELAAAASFFTEHCDRVRVMPFLEGIPCSVHGMVFDDTQIVFRPVEMLTLRRIGEARLHYAGLATYWDPPVDDRERMRDAARRLGAHLRERVDYRGVFTLDGVMGEDGFLPTEVNARVGAGLQPQIVASRVNIPFLSRMVREREPVDLRPADLEALVLERADAHRGGATYTVFERKQDQTEEHPVVETEEGFRPAEGDEVSDGRFVLGPSSVGGFVSFRPDPSRVPRGPSFAPRAARAFAYADDRFGTGIGPLEPARSVR
jgi:hypothetical protein